MTILFYDLVGSTALAARCDPEDFNDAMETFHTEVGGAMRAMGGYVGARVGDGAVVYFGYPEAQEDAADRAVLAGLRALEAGGGVLLPDGEFARVRVGVATGEGVVNRPEEGGGNEVVGSVGNLAARLQAAAEPGCMVVSDATRRLLRNDFELEDLGGVIAKGFKDPVQAWRVIRRAEERQLEVFRAATETPVVGRARELESLDRALDDAERGLGRVVLVTAEAGLGKSRLVREVAQRAHDRGFRRIVMYCSAQNQEDPFRPFIAQVERVRRQATPAGQPAPAGAGLAPGTNPDEAALLAGLLGLPVAESPTLKSLNAVQRRDLRIDALIRQMTLFARIGPVMVIFEDAQWSDPSSLAVVERAVRSTPLHRTLIVITSRPEFDPAWRTAPGVQAMPLPHLNPEESQELISTIPGTSALPPSVRRAICDRADGVPLYLEEVTRAALEIAADSEASPTGEIKLPVTLQDTLLARLDRLGPAKEIAQVAAAIGRRFDAGTLSKLCDASAPLQEEALRRLTASGLIAADADGGPGWYAFKQGLFQQTAYGTLLRARRRELNARLLRIIEVERPTLADTEPERLAQYAAEAGQTEAAAEYWSRAGQQALAQSAMVEAVSRLRRGLSLASELPEGEARWTLALRMELALGKALIATVGYAQPEIGEVFARAKTLCEAIGERAELLAVLHGLWIHEFLRGQLVAARTHADALLSLADSEGNESWALFACRALGALCFPMGRFAEAIPILQRGVALYSPARRPEYAQVLVDDPGVVMLMYLGWVQLYTGRAEDAAANVTECLRQAREIGQPHSLAYALAAVIMHGLFADNFDGAEPLVAELADLAREHEMAYWIATAEVIRGRVQMTLVDVRSGAETLDRGIQSYLRTGSVLYVPTFLMWHAQAMGRLGQVNAGLDLIDRAKAIVAQSGIAHDEAEVLRIEAELHLQRGDDAAARRAVDAAMAVIDRQGAELFRGRLSATRKKVDDKSR